MRARVRRGARTALVGTVAILLPLLTLTGCAYASQDCSQGVCGVLLNGSGAHITIDADQLPDSAAGGDVTVELVEVSGGSAVFLINGERGTCTPDESLMVGGLQITCRGINQDEERMSMEVTA